MYYCTARRGEGLTWLVVKWRRREGGTRRRRRK
jgi:hypothetical protein